MALVALAIGEVATHGRGNMSKRPRQSGHAMRTVEVLFTQLASVSSRPSPPFHQIPV
jgi:hypothetical protein